MDQLSGQDRDYHERLRKKNRWYVLAIIFMAGCLGILFVGTSWYDLKISEQAVSFLMGFFISISGVFLFFIFRNRRTMSNPELLKRERIVKLDERNLAISGKALQITSYIMAFVLMVLSMVGSFVSKSLMMTASGLLYVFILSYLVCWVYFRKKL